MPYKNPEKQKEAQREWEKTHRRAGTRHRVWMFVFYPDSADQDWRETADELGLPFLVSPLHDKDAWTARDERKNPKHIEGELKEAHWHGLVEYPQPVDYGTVKEDFGFLNTTNIKYAKSKASMALYLCHINSKDKAHYDPSEVLEFGGANWHDWCGELEDVHAIMREMRAWLRENVHIHNWEFTEFVDWCDEKNDTWSRALDLKCAWAIGNYMDKQRAKRDYHAKLDRERRRDNNNDNDNEEEEVAEGEACEGLSATPSQGGAEPRTPNPADLEEVSQPEDILFFTDDYFESFPSDREETCGEPSVCPACGEKLWPFVVTRHAVLLDRKLGREVVDGRWRCRKCGTELVVERDVPDPMTDAFPLHVV